MSPVGMPISSPSDLSQLGHLYGWLCWFAFKQMSSFLVSFKKSKISWLYEGKTGSSLPEFLMIWKMLLGKEITEVHLADRAVETILRDRKTLSIANECSLGWTVCVL